MQTNGASPASAVIADKDLGLEQRMGKNDGYRGFRSHYDRDRARIIHSFPFRRLQGKTQVLGIGEGDFHRTRLTHSMEVAQLARGLILRLKELPDADEGVKENLDIDLIEAISFAHDLGHPPFGHAGEVALNGVMKDYGGFEGNGQTLRIITSLAGRDPQYGLDLTRRALLGVLKYPVSYSKASSVRKSKELETNSPQKPPKCFLDTEQKVVDWLLEPINATERELFMATTEADCYLRPCFKTLDCSIMELADDIAYRIYDFEDGLILRLITNEDCEHVQCAAEKCSLGESLNLCFHDASSTKRKGVSEIVTKVVDSVQCEVSDDSFIHPILRYKVTLGDAETTLLKAMKNVVRAKIIDSHQVQTLEYRGQGLVRELFQMITSDPGRLLPESDRQKTRESNSDTHQRIVCDYIAGMTDEFATRFYERLKIPRRGSAFERL